MDRSLNLRERRNKARGTSELDLLDLQRQGQALYRQKKYKEALEVFDQAVLRDAKPPLTVFDNRAATYAKLGKLKAALRDGKQMIEQEKSNCIGYLRTGQILQLLGTPTMALEIYQVGLRRVSTTDSNAKLLHGVRDKLARQCAPPKAVDPLQLLPVEILEMLISYLRFIDIVNMTRVSKPWRRLLSSMPKLWTVLDFSYAPRNVGLDAIRQYVKYAQGTCSAIRFNVFVAYQQNVLNYVAARCKSLREITVSSGFVGGSLLKAAPNAANLQTLVISSQCEITSDTVSQLLGQCKNLERAEFHQVADSHILPHLPREMSKLHTLILNSAYRGVINIPMLVGNIKNVRTLTLRDWGLSAGNDGHMDFSTLSHLQHLDISRAVANLPPRLPPSIRSIDMTKCSRYPTPRTSTPYGQMPVLPYLSSLSTAHCEAFKPSDLMTLLDSNKGNLTKLDISALYSRSDISDLISGGYLQGIEELGLKECPIDDEMALQLSQVLLHLRRLDLACTKVTGVGVKALATGLKGKLEWLGLGECRNTSVDAVELVRSMGVKVSYSFPDKGPPSKRLLNQF